MINLLFADERIFFIFVFISIYGSVLAAPYIRDFFVKTKFEKQREKEFAQNLDFDATGEKHILRYLDETEKQILINEHITEYKLAKLNHFIVPTFILVSVIFIYFVWRFWDYFDKDSDYMELVLRIAIIFGGIFGGYYYKYVRENNLYKDLRAPVFGVRGELLKREVRSKRVTLNYFVVRGLEFSDVENPQIDIYWNDWNEGDTINVEYSPFSKHIWKIEKV